MRSTVLLLGSLALAAAQQGLPSVKTEGGSVVISSLQDVFIEDANGVRTGLNARFSAQQVSWACLRAATIGREIARSVGVGQWNTREIPAQLAYLRDGAACPGVAAWRWHWGLGAVV